MITVEIWMVVRPTYGECRSVKDEMIRISGTFHKRQKGKLDGQERTDLEMHQAEVQEGDPTSGWKTYWRTLRWDWISQTMRRGVLIVVYYIYLVWLMYGHVSSINIAI
jgi:hypothetical protein